MDHPKLSQLITVALGGEEKVCPEIDDLCRTGFYSGSVSE